MYGPEEDFIMLLIASERVEQWLSTIRASGPSVRLAVQELAASCKEREAYAEEARREGAVPLLTGLLKRTEDEELLNHISDALAACSGLMAASSKVRAFCYGDTPVVLKEGALGDGVGAKVWTAAHSFCREMASHPAIVRGRQVLEIGSGCGACGILAAKLGAERVLLTDYVDAVLCNLRDCMHLNSSSSSSSSSGGTAEPEQQGTAAATGRGWDAPPLHVRFYDWQDSLDRLSEQERAELCAAPGVAEGVAAAVAPGTTIDTASNDIDVPRIDAAAQFEVILGTDILYEWPMVEMVPAVLKHRLCPGGRALLCCAVREQAIFDAFLVALKALGMRVGITVVQPQADDVGLLGIRQEYEGGFVLLAAEHAVAPAHDWHRPNLFDRQA